MTTTRTTWLATCAALACATAPAAWAGPSAYSDAAPNVAPLSAPASPNASKVTLSEGHIDAFHITAKDGKLALDLKEDVTGRHVRRKPETVIMHVTDKAFRKDLPKNFPGAPAAHVLPLNQAPGIIWPGWDSSDIAASDFSASEINITNVKGPGTVNVFSTGTFGGYTPVLKSRKFALPGVIDVPDPGHVHAMWSFTKPGTYTLDAQVSAKAKDGKKVVSNKATYTFRVGGSAATPTPTPKPTSKPTPTPTPTPTPGSGEAPSADILKNRKALHHQHVDAAIVTWENGQLAVKTRVGHNVTHPSEVYLQLKKDTHEGVDVSKLFIPKDPALAAPLSFLGKPGETLWMAPGKYYKGWKPIWAGLAADVPDSEIVPGSLELHLDRVDGPSWLENIIYHPGEDGHLYKMLSSRDPEFKALNMHMNNYHVHTSWVFGKPGIYRMVMHAEGKTPKGNVVKSAPSEIIWAVG